MTCPRVAYVTIRCIVLLGLFYPGIASPEPTGPQGKIRGDSHVNIRSGPDVSFPSVAVARQGEIVSVEGQEKSWYRIVLSDGRRGYVHKTLIETLIDPIPSDPIVNQEEKSELPSPPIQRELQPPKSHPSPTIPSVFQGEWGVLQWLLTFLCVFGLGWILGGNYYLRRDRVKRHKLQL